MTMPYFDFSPVDTETEPVPSSVDKVDPVADVPIPPATDRELLTLWIDRKDTASLETLIRRHAPLVGSLARKLLRSPHERADAFQSVFLLLSQQAARIRKRESLASWIYGVTVRTCLMAARTSRTHVSLMENHGAIPAPDWGRIEQTEMAMTLDEELDRLPAHLRETLVLVYLEGNSRQAAADLTNTTEQTIKSRLARAKSLLRTRLLRRGFTFSLALTAYSLTSAEKSADAGIPDSLIDETLNTCQIGHLPTPSTVPLDATTLLAAGTPTMSTTTATYSTLAIATLLLLTTLGAVSNGREDGDMPVLLSTNFEVLQGVQEITTATPVKLNEPKPETAQTEVAQEADIAQPTAGQVIAFPANEATGSVQSPAAVTQQTTPSSSLIQIFPVDSEGQKLTTEPVMPTNDLRGIQVDGAGASFQVAEEQRDELRQLLEKYPTAGFRAVLGGRELELRVVQSGFASTSVPDRDDLVAIRTFYDRKEAMLKEQDASLSTQGSNVSQPSELKSASALAMQLELIEMEINALQKSINATQAAKETLEKNPAEEQRTESPLSGVMPNRVERKQFVIDRMNDKIKQLQDQRESLKQTVETKENSVLVDQAKLIDDQLLRKKAEYEKLLLARLTNQGATLSNDQKLHAGEQTRYDGLRLTQLESELYELAVEKQLSKRRLAEAGQSRRAASGTNDTTNAISDNTVVSESADAEKTVSASKELNEAERIKMVTLYQQTLKEYESLRRMLVEKKVNHSIDNFNTNQTLDVIEQALRQIESELPIEERANLARLRTESLKRIVEQVNATLKFNDPTNLEKVSPVGQLETYYSEIDKLKNEMKQELFTDAPIVTSEQAVRDTSISEVEQLQSQIKLQEAKIEKLKEEILKHRALDAEAKPFQLAPNAPSPNPNIFDAEDLRIVDSLQQGIRGPTDYSALLKLMMKEQELLQEFGAEHPEVQKVRDGIQLHKRLLEIRGEVDSTKSRAVDGSEIGVLDSLEFSPESQKPSRELLPKVDSSQATKSEAASQNILVQFQSDAGAVLDLPRVKEFGSLDIQRMITRSNPKARPVQMQVNHSYPIKLQPLDEFDDAPSAIQPFYATFELQNFDMIRIEHNQREPVQITIDSNDWKALETHDEVLRVYYIPSTVNEPYMAQLQSIVGQYKLTEDGKRTGFDPLSEAKNRGTVIASLLITKLAAKSWYEGVPEEELAMIRQLEYSRLRAVHESDILRRQLQELREKPLEEQRRIDATNQSSPANDGGMESSNRETSSSIEGEMPSVSFAEGAKASKDELEFKLYSIRRTVVTITKPDGTQLITSFKTAEDKSVHLPPGEYPIQVTIEGNESVHELKFQGKLRITTNVGYLKAAANLETTGMVLSKSDLIDLQSERIEQVYRYDFEKQSQYMVRHIFPGDKSDDLYPDKSNLVQLILERVEEPSVPAGVVH